MTEEKNYRLGCLVSTIICILLFVCLTAMELSIMNILILNFIWVLSFIVPCIFVYLDCNHSDGESLACLIPLIGSYICGFINTCWWSCRFLGNPLTFEWWKWLLFIVFYILLNFSPIGIISWEIMIADASMMASVFGDSKDNQGSREDGSGS